MPHRRAVTSALALVVLTAACSGSDARTSDVAADTVAIALAQFDPAQFDTIQWPADSAALERGAYVWSISCSQCHGVRGQGDGKFVMKGDTLRPPNFLTGEWRFAADRPGLRQQIYVGTNTGMPHWGLVGLKPRDIDAVSRYILEVMRVPSMARR